MAGQNPDTSLYDMLEVGTNATIDEIEASYSRIVAYLDADALAIYSMIDEEEVARLRSDVDAAFRTLSDPDRRAAYDRNLGGASSSYPSVLVPETPTGTSMSVGRVVGESANERAPEPEILAEATPPDTEPKPPAPPASPTSTTPEPEAPAEDARATGLHHAEAATAAQPGKRRMRLKPTLEIDLTPDTEFSGALLKRLRESADATLNDVAEITKISKHYLRALEENDFDALPAAVYVRGFVFEYARAMGLDGKMVTSSFMRLFERYNKRGEGE
ncbi:MAG: helix-turn-helix domain-containing protein [Myxococcota bacterium]